MKNVHDEKDLVIEKLKEEIFKLKLDIQNK